MTQTIWLHGAGQHGDTWGPVPEGRCPDLPGHRAAPRVMPPEVGRYAEVIGADLPARYHLVGHSLGAMVAMQIAAGQPQRCATLVLLDPPLSVPLGPWPRLGPVFAAMLARFPGPRGIAPVMARRVERAEGRPVVQQAIAAMSQGGLSDAMAAAAGFDGTPLLPRLTMPTLAILGRRSLLTGPGTERALRAGLPRGTVEVWETGHMIPFDAPDAVIARVQGFQAAQQ